MNIFTAGLVSFIFFIAGGVFMRFRVELGWRVCFALGVVFFIACFVLLVRHPSNYKH